MWVAQYAQGLMAKPFASRVPLFILAGAGAGAASDAAFFLLPFFSMETFNFDKTIAKRGCFPYTNDYPYSHSVAGIAAVGVVMAVFHRLLARVYASPKDLAVIVATSASHFFLEWPSHRAALGASLFDSPSGTFVAEMIIFFLGFGIYALFSPLATQTGLRNRSYLAETVFLVMIIQQAVFCFGSAPTLETRWVHAPFFLSEIIGSCWLLGKLDAQTSGVIPNSGLDLPSSHSTIKQY